MSIATEIVNAITENNAFLKHTQVGRSLSTSCRRASYTKREFGIVEPVEFVISENKQTVVYIPVLKMLQALLNKEEILHKALKCNTGGVQGYNTFRDGSCFKENTLLVEEKNAIALGLYIDDFEVVNPLGTSKTKHKICAVYWVLLNLASKFRSSLKCMQLALLCKANTVKACGYSEVLWPLLYDLEVLEKHGVYVDNLGSSVKGTVLHIAADNLAAHSLGGFLESFVSDKICRFCMVSRQEIQDKEVSLSNFCIKTQQNHDQQVLKVQQDPKLINLIYMKEGTRMSVSRDMKHDILQKLAEEMYKYLAYPQDEHFSVVAEALIGKHPCLKEPRSTRACNGRKNSLKFKMGNLRTKLRRCGLADVSVNGNKRTQQNPNGVPPAKNIKRPRRSETNFLPKFPKGEDKLTLESSRLILENELKKRSPNGLSVNHLMNQTFSLRRKEIVEEQLSVKLMLERWPALLCKQQVSI